MTARTRNRLAVAMTVLALALGVLGVIILIRNGAPA